MIRQGHVTVNGAPARIGQRADPGRDRIAVDGKPIRVKRSFVYVALYKPQGILSDEGDGTGEFQTARALLPIAGHLFPVGRLDLKREGLLLFTDDGELANLLTHPRYEHSKEYQVLVQGHPNVEALERWRRGVPLDDGVTLPADVSILEDGRNTTWLRVVLREGRKRQIRRVAYALGHPVERLIRVRVGPVRLGAMKSGEWRYLNSREREALERVRTRRKRRSSPRSFSWKGERAKPQGNRGPR